jgi:putative transcriptional regulator
VELGEEAWIVAPAHAADAFDDDPGTLWRRALERLGGRYAMVARMPDDPENN